MHQKVSRNDFGTILGPSWKLSPGGFQRLIFEHFLIQAGNWCILKHVLIQVGNLRQEASRETFWNKSWSKLEIGARRLPKNYFGAFLDPGWKLALCLLARSPARAVAFFLLGFLLARHTRQNRGSTDINRKSNALPFNLLGQVSSRAFFDFFASLGAFGSHLVAKMPQDSA